MSSAHCFRPWKPFGASAPDGDLLSDPRVLDTFTGDDALDEIHDLLEQFWIDHPQVPPLVRLHLAIAAAEIGANIIEHAAVGKRVSLRVEVRLQDNAISMAFTDSGCSAVGLDLSDPPPSDALSERGRGLAIARRVLEALSYQRSGNMNYWTLVGKPFA